MKIITITTIVAATLFAGCASEFEIAASDVPQAVVESFKAKYPGATDVEWEVEKEDGKLFFEAEFKLNGKEVEAHFRPDGTFSGEE
ncbi:MAG TPA: hypothetical protein VF473_04555 [Cyclobacteriaceae bacterium]